MTIYVTLPDGEGICKCGKNFQIRSAFALSSIEACGCGILEDIYFTIYLILVDHFWNTLNNISQNFTALITVHLF